MTLKNPYVGKAGQLAVMGELAWRGYNVALPEIDKGDDIYSVSDKTGGMLRIQVKTSKATPLKNKQENKFEFSVRMAAILEPFIPELYFVFACRLGRGFRFLVLSREVLRNYVATYNAGRVGEVARGGRRFDIHLSDDGAKARCGQLDWSNHIDDWSVWPSLDWKS